MSEAVFTNPSIALVKRSNSPILKCDRSVPYPPAAHFVSYGKGVYWYNGTADEPDYFMKAKELVLDGLDTNIIKCLMVGDIDV